MTIEEEKRTEEPTYFFGKGGKFDPDRKLWKDHLEEGMAKGQIPVPRRANLSPQAQQDLTWRPDVVTSNEWKFLHRPKYRQMYWDAHGGEGLFDMSEADWLEQNDLGFDGSNRGPLPAGATRYDEYNRPFFPEADSERAYNKMLNDSQIVDTVTKEEAGWDFEARGIFTPPEQDATIPEAFSHFGGLLLENTLELVDQGREAVEHAFLGADNEKTEKWMKRWNKIEDTIFGTLSDWEDATAIIPATLQAASLRLTYGVSIEDIKENEIEKYWGDYWTLESEPNPIGLSPSQQVERLFSKDWWSETVEEGRGISDVIYGNLFEQLNPFDNVTGADATMKTVQMAKYAADYPETDWYALSRDLSNPVGEMIGRMVFDPTNLLDLGLGIAFKGMRYTKMMTKAIALTPEVAKIADGVKMGKMGLIGRKIKQAAKLIPNEAVRVALNLDDAVRDTSHLDAVTKAFGVDYDAVRAARLVDAGPPKNTWTMLKKLGQLTTTSKQIDISKKAVYVMRWVDESLRMGGRALDADEYYMVLKRVADLANPVKRKEAIDYLSKYGNVYRLMTEEGMNGVEVISDMIKKYPGLGKRMLTDLAELGDDASGIDKFMKLILTADEAAYEIGRKMYPTVDELIEQVGKKNIPFGVRALNKVNNAFNATIGGWQRAFFGTVQLGLNPGYAVRNGVQNLVSSVLDEGTSVILGHKHLDEGMSWLGVSRNTDGSFFTQFAGHDVMDKYVASLNTHRAMADLNRTQGTKWWKWDIRDGSDAVENFSMRAIAGKVIPETMKKGLEKVTRKIMHSDFGFSGKHSKYIERLLMSKFGDVTKTFDVLRADALTGIRKVIGVEHMPTGLRNSVDEYFGVARYDELIDEFDDIEDAVVSLRDRQKGMWDEVDDALKNEVVTPSNSGNIDEMEDAVQGGQVADAVMEGVISNETAQELHSAYNALGHVTSEVSHALHQVERRFLLGLDGKAGKVDMALRSKWEKVQRAIEINVPEAFGGGKMSGFDFHDTQMFGALYRNGVDKINDVFDKWIRAAEIADRAELQQLWKHLGFKGDMGNLGRWDVRSMIIDEKFMSKQRLAHKWRDANFTMAVDFSEQVGEAALKMGAPSNRVWKTDALFSRAETAMDVSRTFDKHLPYQLVKDQLNRGKKLLKTKPLEGAKELALGWARQFGYPQSTANGIKMDQYILNVLNKQLDRKFTSLDALHNVAPEQIEKALLRHSIGLVNKAIDDPTILNDVLKGIANGVDLTHDESMLANTMVDMLDEINPALKAEFAEVRFAIASTDDVAEKAKLLTKMDGISDKIAREFAVVSNIPHDVMAMTSDELHAISMRYFKLYPDEGKAYAQNARALRTALEENAADIEKAADAASTPEDIAASRKAYEASVEKAQSAFDDSKNALEEAIQKKIGVKESLRDTEEILEDVVRKENLTTPQRVWGGDTSPMSARTVKEQQPKIDKMYDELEEHLRDRWDKWEAVDEGDPKAYLKRLDEAEKRMNDVVRIQRDVSVRVAEATSNFILHDYARQRNFDLVLAYIYPYSFWYTRTYAAWLQRVVSKPGVIQAYANYKQTMASIHSDMPEHYKYTQDIAPFLRLIGIDMENPLFANLEAMLNPLYGVLGVDFNDADKRGTQMGRFMDNLGKVGPSIHQGYGIAYGLYNYMKGEDEAGKKWVGRIFGGLSRAQRAAFDVLNVGPVEGGVELDPMIVFAAMAEGREWWQGEDPYERGRIARGLYGMVDREVIDPDQFADAVREGWDNENFRTAVAYARSNRTAGDLVSFAGSPAFRTRTPEDMEVDQIDMEISRVYDMRDEVDKDRFSELLGEVYDKYPAAGLLQLARKDPDQRDTAYTYNVLRRIPAGASGEFYERAGLTREQVQEFYDSKGANLETMTKDQRTEFMTGIVDLGMTLATPADATAQEWEAAGKSYQWVEEQLLDNYGEDTKGLVDEYWRLIKFEDRSDAYALTDKYPEIQDWLTDRTQMLNNDPLLRKYYASYGGGRAMYNSMSYDAIADRFPAMEVEQQAYYDAKARGEKVKASDKLKAYWAYKDVMEEHYDNLLLSFGRQLPEGPEINFRTTYPEEKLTEGAKDIIAQGGIESEVPEWINWEWGDWASKMTPALQRVISDWAFRGAPLNDSAEQSLEYAFKDYDISLPMMRDLIRQSLDEAGAQFYSEENPPSEYGGP